MAPGRLLDNDLILTISDNDSLPASDVESLSEIETTKPSLNASTKRKRRYEPARQTAKKQKTASKILNGKKSASLPPEEEDADTSGEEQGLQDGAIDPDFEFDVGGNDLSGVVEDFDGWGQTGSTKQKGDKKGVDIDEIIARRAAKREVKEDGDKTLHDPQTNGLEVEEELEIGGYEDEDEQEGDGIPNFEDDELLAPDGFGAEAASEDEDENEEEDEDEDEEDDDMGDGEDDDTPVLNATGDAGDSDDDSVASPTAHPDDLALNHSEDESQTSTSDIEERAKRTAFFAPDTKQASKPDAEPTTSFTQFSLSRPLLRALASNSLATPTPIQVRAIPLALQGLDLVCSAVTGSGKTLAFLLPILERLLYRPRRIPTTRVAILLPTRELAVQCANVASSLSKLTDITFASLIGGFSLREQENILKKRPDVVIATPGRFIDHMRNSPSFTTETLEILVLDEADRMLEDGFADELDEILKSIPKGRQTMLFSATMTESVDRLVRVGMNRPVRVSVDKRKETSSGLVQEFVRLRAGREDKRLATLCHLCLNVYKERTIVFFRQKKEAHRVRIIFGLLGIKSSELHGSMSQEQRIAAVTSFRDGRTSHLLATDLASRGLDIKNVATVLNYEAPQSHEIYVHRVGRTARAGKQGHACTIAAEPDRNVVKAAVKSARTQGAKVVSRVVDPTDIDNMDTQLSNLEEEIDAILKEEQEEKQLASAETQLHRGENIVRHEEEIMSRPRRTWFESAREKELAKKTGRVELNGMEVKNDRKGKTRLSNKDKKRLDDRRERVGGAGTGAGAGAVVGGKLWRKGRGDADAVRGQRRDNKAKKKEKTKGKRGGGGDAGKPMKVGRSAGKGRR